MSAARLIAGLQQAGKTAAAAAEARAGARLLAAVAAALPGDGVTVARTEDGGVALSGRGLKARAFGGRRRAADPLFAGLLATLARGEPR